MLGRLNDHGRRARERLIARARGPIRERAIRRAKSRIALANLQVEDLSERDLENLVAEEEEKIISRLWQMPFFALLVFLGLA